MKIKTCHRCKKELHVNYFYKSRDRKGGFQEKCKTCLKEYNEKNKEKIREYQKQYREQNKEIAKEYNKDYREKNQEKLSEQKKKYFQETKNERQKKQKEYYEINKEDIELKKREYYLQNREKILAYTKEWRKEWAAKNKEKTRFYNNKYRAQKRNLPSTLTKEQWMNIKISFDYKCAYCGMEKLLEQEHFIPLSKGGEYTKNNIVPACRSCNSSKRDKKFFEWYPSYEYYSKQRENKVIRLLNY